MLGLNRKTVAQIFLVIAVLITQVFVLAHEAGHELSADNDHCWVCLHSPHFKAAAPASTAKLVVPAGHADRVVQPPSAVLALVTAGPGARGPPATLRA